MKRRARFLAVVVALVCVLSAGYRSAVACTGICIKPRDGSVIAARTLEFGDNLQSSVIMIPRATEMVGTAPGGKPGLRWKSQYAILGVNTFDLPAILDGLNEKGLSAGLFYFPGYAQYQETPESEFDKTIASWELPVYLLANCATVEEATEALKKIRVGAAVQKNMGYSPSCHYRLVDAGGRCIVVEYVDGNLKIHENPLGVTTNAPTFDWHITNLCNYLNLTPNGAPAVDYSGMKISSLGQGSGMLGLPGDFTPPSRFVRAVMFSRSALPVATAREGVLQAFHVLNQFDIPKGSSRDVEQGREVFDHTYWTGGADLKNHRYYFRTFENSRIRVVDLEKMDLNGKEIKTFSMAGQEVFEELSAARN